MTYREAQQLVKRFETCTLPPTDWSHLAHFVMATWYIYHHPVVEARKLIKDGIKKYNVSNGGKNTEEEGYHETTTEFYIQAIMQYHLEFVEDIGFENFLRELASTNIIHKDFLLGFYTKELLMSRDARVSWEIPDLKPMSRIRQAILPT
ncbi:MAG: hypothetical protein RIF36_24210 [Imperialibacter sp.]|uniref:hypothetical protein n=1 Tax=Imperialibacter sp. TaxID=2038411 RepID=UPI0032EB582F